MTTPKSKPAVNTLLAPAAINILKYNIFFMLLCLPLQGLSADEPDYRLTYDNEYWTLKDLPKIIINTPAPKPEFEVFVITKISNGTWRIGGSLRSLDAELLYVDRKNRVIGPYTSILDPTGRPLTSEKTTFGFCSSKASQKKTQSNVGRYNACRSEFYTADKFQKGTQAVLACALLGCLFGYDSDWKPIFRPRLLKEAIIGSGLMGQLAKNFLSNEIQLIHKIDDEFTEKTSQIRRKIEAIQVRTSDKPGLRASGEMLDSLVRSYDQHLSTSLRAADTQSRPYNRLSFSLDKRRWQDLSKKLTQQHERTKTMMIEIQNNIVETLSNLEIAERAERELVSEIQSVLQQENYYTATVDGMFGLGTIAALNKFSADVGSLASIATEENSTILKTIKSSLIKPDGDCSTSVNDAKYVVCFSLK